MLKNIILLVSILLLTGCAENSIRQQAANEFGEYNKATWPLVESGQVKYSEYYSHAQSIAEKYNSEGGMYNTFYLKEQSLRMERGEISKDELLKLIDKVNFNHGTGMMIEARVFYRSRNVWEPLCKSFGYAPGTPNFRKCIYDTGMHEYEVERQHAQSSASNYNPQFPPTQPAPQTLLPQPQYQPPKTPITTNCQVIGNQWNCVTN